MSDANATAMTQSYRTENGTQWSIVWTRSGRRFAVMGDFSIEIGPAYMAQNWFQDPLGDWHILRTRRIRLMEALEYLALDLLPWWENYIHENFSKRIRPAWSHDGANVLVESNKLYYLVVHTALRIRRNRGLTQLVLIPYMNIKHRADILAGILGLAWAFHKILGERVLDIKAIVVGATVGMRDLWELPTFRDEFRIDVLGDRLLDSRELRARYIDVHPSVREIQMYRQQMMRMDERNVDTLIYRALRAPMNRLVFAFLWPQTFKHQEYSLTSMRV